MKTPDARCAIARLPTLVLLCAAVLLAGCIYRPDIQQGNLLTTTDVDQVTVGMTRSQVRYLLGTPMVSDPFAPHRWDYVYRLTHGRKRRVESAHFLVRFEGDTVVAVEKIIAPRTAPPREPPAAEPPPAEPPAAEPARTAGG